MQSQGMNCVVGQCVQAPNQPVMGGRQDTHGCVLGGGYSWCETKQKCLRQWEEACESSSSEASVDAPPAVGGTTDEHGCVKGGGYQWCDTKQKCLRQWEEPCEAPQARNGKPLQNFMLNVMGALPTDQQAQVHQFMDSLREKRAAYAGGVRQKLAELRAQGGSSPFLSQFKPIRDQVKSIASELKKSLLPRRPELIGAHEDNRPSAEAKQTPVTDGNM